MSRSSNLRVLAFASVSLVFGAAACGSDDGVSPRAAAGAAQAGSGSDTAGTSGDTGGSTHAGGAAGRGGNGTAGDPTAGSSNTAGAAGDGAGGTAGAGASSGMGNAGSSGLAGSAGSPVTVPLDELFERGELTSDTEPRPAFGAVVIAATGDRVYAVESRRDVETGPLGLPWRSRFRLAAYDAGVKAWEFAAEPDDVVSDVVVHPSGDVTIAVLHYPADREGYDLMRFDRDGTPLGTTTLAEPATIPSLDYGDGPEPLFRMKSDLADATVGGWVQLIANGEGLAAAFLSYVDAPSDDPMSVNLALGLELFDWEANTYAERWARVVEGPHRAEPAAWAYDELRWRDQAIRPFFARDSENGDFLVGRAWNTTRCEANVTLFAEFTDEECMLGAVNPLENERFPLAVTRFNGIGDRLGTRLLVPDADAAEQVPFALVARGGKLAVAGSVVRELPDGSPRTYPDPDGYVDYDGYIALYDTNGAPLLHHDFNQGRGDVLAALIWTLDGLVAAGSSGWDRWQGGMSISRGADPLLAWLSEDAERSGTRVLPLSDGSRHYNLHDLAIAGGNIVAAGFSDAPMTHSADDDRDAARTFGALRVQLAVTP